MEMIISSADNDNVKSNAIVLKAVIHAFARSQESRVTPNAEYLLRAMEEIKDNDARPHTQHYIQVIGGSDEKVSTIRVSMIF